MQTISVVVCVLIVAFATDRAHAQGFPGAVPPFRPVPGFSNRRQLLTPVQQTHILSDVQQHQHRFAFPQSPNQVEPQQQHQQQQSQQHQRPPKSYQPNKSPNFQLEAAISKQLPTQTTIVNQPRQQQHFQQHQQPPQQHHHHHHHPQQQQQQQFVQQQQSLQSQNNFRTVVPSAPVPTEQHHVQHHTQTNFIPNYVQQQQQQQQPQHQPQHHQQQPRQQPSFNSPFAGPQPTQQLSQQYHQQPLNQRSIQSPYAQQQQLIAQQKPFQPSIPYVEPAVGAVSDEQRIVFGPQQQPQQPSARPQPVQTAQQIQQFQQQATFQQPQQQQQFQGQFAQQQPQQQPQFYNPAPEDDERIREKQKIIQKHEQFVQKQYQKQQSRVKQQHEEFLSKQRQIKDQSPSQQYQHQVQQQYNVRGRPVQPFEADAFQRAVKVYQDAHPTTAAPTTTTSTTTTTTTPRPAKRQQRPTSNSRRPAELNDEDLEQYLKTHRQKLYGELRQEVDSHKSPKKSKQIKSTKALGKDDLLKQLKLALAENPQQELGNRTYDSMDIVLPDGQKVQVIRTTDPKLIEGASPLVPERLVRPASTTTTTTENPQEFYQHLAQGSLLPTGANFEVIRQSADGQVQTVDQLPASPQKKVTFVYLEEQNDGSFKVHGVKSNGDKEAKTSGAEVDSIVSRIQNGDIKLPPSSARTSPASVATSVGTTTPVTTTTTPRPAPSTQVTASSPYYSSQYPSSPSSAGPSSPSSIEPQVHFASSPSPYSTLVTRDDDNTIQLASASSSHYPSSTPQSVTVNGGLSSFQPSAYNSSPRSTIFESSTPRSVSQQYESSPSTVAPPTFDSPAPPLQHQQQQQQYVQQQQQQQQQYPSSTAQPLPSSPHAYHHSASVHTPIAYQPTSPAPSSPTAAYTAAETVAYTPDADTTYFQTSPTTPASIVSVAASTEAPASELSLILKGRGLHAMSKYLRQSGLDSILNETGPYTVFAPTDKAFKNLLVQLGGPERAEEKFRSNPRLLSGLLLHHVIPGSFQIGSLQDEMTGVSLAGTQLRVNQYNLHDTEWNDITITTINGAMVVPEKNDITIPQGIAHAVDRVMFPLPVGDILQTLQSDREHRFSNFLKALTTSGLAELLQNKDAGAKTYTVFAPVDGAFTNSTEEELHQLLGDKDEATKFVMRHVSSGTLFSAGMRFYQVRDALNGASPITIQKTNNGKVKINEAQIMTPNIPTTNGVIHAIDALL